MSALIGLECPECGASFDVNQLQTIRETCDSSRLTRLARELDRA